MIGGANSPFVYPLGDPRMLPHESDADGPNLPNGTDTTMYDVSEDEQVDTIILNNQNVHGTNASIGTLLADQFVGMKMANNIVIKGDGPFGGIYFKDIEVVVLNLGNGVDQITVENTSQGKPAGCFDDYHAVRLPFR